MRSFLTISLVAVGLAYVASAAAEVPYLIPVVGMVSDADDEPLDGMYDVVFALYDAQDAMANVWSEEYTGEDAIEFEDGLFRAYLGTQTSLDTYINHFLDNDELWLGMKIGSDVEMTRVRFAAVPWSIEAEHCGRIGDYEADDLQPAIGSAACSGGEFLQGWDPVGGAVCNQMSVPEEYLTETEGSALYVPLPTSDLSTCEFGLAWNGAGGVLDCMDEADVRSRCYTSHGDDAYLGSDGACHNAPHSCSAEQYMDGAETCRDGPQVCTATQYMDGNGDCHPLAGTSGYLPLFTPDGQSLGDSAVYQDGTSLVLGGTSGGGVITVLDNGTEGGPQLHLGGSDSNAGVNASGYKLHISNYDNDDEDYTYPIYVQDENSGVDFWLRSRSSEGGRSTAYFQGDVGIGTSSPEAPLHIEGGTDAEPSGGGYLVIGSTATGDDSLAIDSNEIQARNGTDADTLYIQNSGGTAHFGDDISWDGHLLDIDVSSEYTATDTGGDPNHTTMVSSGNSVCFLVDVEFWGIDNEPEAHGKCDLYIDSGNWILRANRDGDTDGVWCAARCISW